MLQKIILNPDYREDCLYAYILRIMRYVASDVSESEFTEILYRMRRLGVLTNAQMHDIWILVLPML